MADRNKRSYKPRKIKETHMNKPEFKSWVTKIIGGNDESVFCNKCKVTIKADITSLKRHMVNKLNIN